MLTLTIVCFVGCAMPGSREEPTISQSSTQNPAPQVAANQTTSNEGPGTGFSIARMLQMAGFQKPEAVVSSLVPQEMVNLGNVVNSVTAKAAELNANDPPEVTRQKAQAILESLQTWDSTLAASHSTGLVNSETAQTLNVWVGQIRGEAQKLVQFVPNPETIAVIQQLAGSLDSTFGSISNMVNQGGAVSQAMLQSNRG